MTLVQEQGDSKQSDSEEHSSPTLHVFNPFDPLNQTQLPNYAIMSLSFRSNKALHCKNCV